MDDQSLFNILQNIRAKELMKNKLRSYAGCCFSAIFEHRLPLLKNVRRFLLEDICIFQTNQFLIEIRNFQLKEGPFL